MGGDGGFQASMLLGPLGGLLAIAFGAGAVSGWGFCVVTILRITNKQIGRMQSELDKEKEDCAREISELKGRVKEVEDRYTQGLERWLDRQKR